MNIKVTRSNCREFGRNGIFERPDDGGDRRGLDAGASESAVAVGQGVGGRTRRASRGGRRRRRSRGGRDGRIAVALGGGRGRGRPAGIARPALAVDDARRSDRPRQQLGGVAAGRAEIEGGDAGTNADEDQHLLRLAPLIVGAIGRAAIGARHDLLDLLLRERRRSWAAPTLRGHRASSLHRQRLPSGKFSVGFSWACPLLSDVTRRTPFGADRGIGLVGHSLPLRDLVGRET